MIDNLSKMPYDRLIKADFDQAVFMEERPYWSLWKRENP